MVYANNNLNWSELAPNWIVCLWGTLVSHIYYVENLEFISLFFASTPFSPSLLFWEKHILLAVYVLHYFTELSCYSLFDGWSFFFFLLNCRHEAPGELFCCALTILDAGVDII